MAGDYRKYSVEMKGGEVGYRLWKRGRQSVVCVFETYKEKRAVYFSVSNLFAVISAFERGRQRISSDFAGQAVTGKLFIWISECFR